MWFAMGYRMRRSRTMLAALTLLGAFALARTSGARENLGVPVHSGDAFTAVIGSASDEDCFVLDLSEGGTLTVSLKAGKGQGVLLGLRILRPDGTEAALGGAVKGAGTGKVSLKNLPVQDTGLWAVCVSATGGTPGTYTISIKTKAPKKTSRKGLDVPASQDVLCEATGADGAALSFTVVEKSGPPLSAVEVEDPAGDPVAATIVRKGSKVSAKAVALSSGFGRYAVRLTGGDADAVVDCTVTVKFAAVAGRKVTLGPEPSLSGVQPPEGRDGVPVTVTGTNLVAGARVFFGDAEATGVVVAPDGNSLTCTTPGGAGSDAGLDVDVLVQNPDGQTADFLGAYAYLGVPGPGTASPPFSPLAGGVTITISGSQFRAGSTVTVGGLPAANVQVVNDLTITCVTPAHAEGTVDVFVYDEFDRPGAPMGHTYLGPPTASAADPSSAPSHGGDVVTVTGTRFRAGERVFVDGSEVTPVSVASLGELSFAMPAGPKGPATLQVMDDYGQSSPVYTDLLSRAASFVDRAASVPAAPAGGDFFGKASAIGDLDEDGDKDLVVLSSNVQYDASSLPRSLPWLLRNDGSWSFTDRTESDHADFAENGDHGQGAALLVGDVDADGDADVLLGRRYPLASATQAQYSTYYTPPGGTVQVYYAYDYPTYLATRVLKSDGTGKLVDSTAASMPAPTSTPLFGSGERWQAAAMAMGDLDGTGGDDLVLVGPGPGVQQGEVRYYAYYSNGRTYVYFYQYGSYVSSTRVMTGDGSGDFTLKTGAIPAPVTNGYGYVTETFDGDAVAVGDLDGDGDRDIVITRSYPFYYYKYNPGTGYGYYYVVPATRVLKNNGTGTFSFSPASMPATYASLYPGSYDAWEGDAVAIGDLDGDGHTEIVVGRRFAGYWYDQANSVIKLLPAVRIFQGSQGGTFTDATGTFLADPLFRTGGPDTILSANGISLGDLDGDGDLDMVTSGSVYYVYDFNATGAGYYGIVPSGYRTASHVLVNDGTGSLADATSKWLTPPVNGDFRQSDGVMLGDLDGDGDLDLVFTYEYFPNAPALTTGNNRPLRIFENR